MISSFEFVRCCAAAQIDPTAKDRLRALLHTEINWHEVEAVANEHCLVPAIVETLSTADIAHELPVSCLDNLREACRGPVEHSMKLVGELIRLYRVFETAQIPVFPYKGPVLSMLAYGDTAKRIYADLDFALPQKDIPQALAAMESAGYRAEFDPREAHDGKSAFAPGQYLFSAAEEAILVELHTERTLRYFPTRLDFRELNERAIQVEIGGQILRTFSIEDTLVFLCVHGTKHFWNRLAWIFDIAKLMKAEDVDWMRLEQIASKLKTFNMVLLGLVLANEFFAAPVQKSMLQNAQRNRKVRKLAKAVRDQFEGKSRQGAGIWSRAAFRLRSSDRTLQGFGQMLRLAFSPTESDRGALALPQPLAPLYAIVRPLRLLLKYGVRSKFRRETSDNVPVLRAAPKDHA